MKRLPQVNARELIHFLKYHGFVEERQRGSHLILIHPGDNLTITIPVPRIVILDVVCSFAF